VTAGLILPLLLHFVLVLGLYAALTAARALAVRNGQATHVAFVRADGDPPAAARIQRNLANQFEAPLFAYFAAAVLISQDAVTALDVAAGWLFLFGRVIHTGVQTLTDKVRLRGLVFLINFVGIVALMAHVALLALERAP
jgi:hypothetical protein